MLQETNVSVITNADNVNTQNATFTTLADEHGVPKQTLQSTVKCRVCNGTPCNSLQLEANIVLKRPTELVRDSACQVNNRRACNHAYWKFFIRAMRIPAFKEMCAISTLCLRQIMNVWSNDSGNIRSKRANDVIPFGSLASRRAMRADSADL